MNAQYPQLGTTLTVISIALGGLALLAIVGRGLRKMFGFISRGNKLFDRLQAMLDEWEGKPMTPGDPPRATIPHRVQELEVAMTALHRARRRPTA